MKEFIHFPPIPIRPVTEVTPFTYRDGFTYLSILNQVVEWIRDKIVPKLSELDEVQAAYIEDVNKRIQDIVNELNETLATLDPDHVKELVKGLEPRIKALEDDLKALADEYHGMFINLGSNRIAVENDGNIIGELLRIRVTNVSGEPLPAFTPVSIAHSNNADQSPSIERYDGSKPIVGITTTNIPNSGTGFAVKTGYVYGDTTAYADGDILFADTSGKLTKETTPYQCAVVTKVSVQGSIFVTLEVKLDKTIADIGDIFNNMKTMLADARQYSITASTNATDAKNARDAAVTARDAAVQARDAAVEAANRIDYSDSGWKALGTPGANSGVVEQPQYRIINGIIYYRGVMSMRMDSALSWFNLVANIAPEALPVGDVAMTFQPYATDCVISGGLYVADRAIEIFLNAGKYNNNIRFSGSAVAPPK